MDNLNTALIHDSKTFEEIVYTEKGIKGREFQSCNFKKCDLSNTDLSHNKFLNCVFEDCNLSMITLDGSTLNDVTFTNCKMLGINFTNASSFLFSVKFDGCILDYSSFMGRKMLKTPFIKSSLKEVTFSQANLAGSSFDGSNLMDTVFNRTNLSAVNFVTAYNYNIEPELNIVKNAVFSSQGLAGLLSSYQIKIV
ncbi:pentapeptide repeat-containing protein [Mucilaginibacter sp.]